MPQLSLVSQFGNPTFSSLMVNGSTNLSGSFYTSGSLNVSGSIFASGSLVVSGTIIAQTLAINSTVYSSGSNVFGNSASNTQVFTGSMFVRGTVSGSSFAGSGANLIAIPNAALTNSTISGISLGSNLATLTIGTGLSGTSYNGSTGVTIANSITNTNQLTNGAGFITSAGTAAAISQTVTGTNSAELVRGNMADNDQFRILVGGTASNAGFVEIATADDGTEPIYVRQYTGTFSSLTRTATLLDGSGNTSFPGTVSAAAASISGNLTVSSGNATGGGIILADDGDIVDLNDGFCAMRFSNGVRVHAGNRTGGAVIRLGNGGDIIASSDITAYGSPSDITLKENVKPIETALDKILKLQGVTFEWKEGTDTRDMTHIKEDIGFIAQQVQEIVPELVRKNDNGLLSLRDKGITALLVEAIKEQQKQIEELKTIVNGLT